MDDSDSASGIERLLERIRAGDGDAADELVTVLYADLQSRARALMRRQPKDHTLQATALVNEACIRLVKRHVPYTDRLHFLRTVTTTMRCVLVDHARRKNRDKRPDGSARVPLDGFVVAFEDVAIDLINLDDALSKLACVDADMARAVELRFFGGLDVTETAAALDMSKRTFERNWAATRAWLQAELL